jgi:hypothetical protein
MTSFRTRWASCAAIASVALLLAPAMAASASSDSVAKSTTHYGSNPNSAFCVAVKNEQTGVSQNQSTVQKEMKSGKLALVKQASLQIFAIDVQAAQNVQSSLHNAPAKVKAAVAETLKFDAALKSIIQKAKTLSGLQSSETAAAGDPKVTAAGQVLTAYFDSQCNSRTKSS